MTRLMLPAGAKRVAQWVDSLERATTYDSWGQLVEATEEYEGLAKGIGAMLGSEECQFADDPMKFLNRLKIVVTMRATVAQDLAVESPLKLEDLKSLIPVLRELPSDCPSEFPIHVKGLRQQFEDLPAMVPKSRKSVDAEERPPPPQTLSSARPTGLPSDKSATAAAAAASAATPNTPNARANAAASAAASAAPSSAAGGGGGDDEGDEDGAVLQSGSLLPRKRFPPGQTNITARVEKIQLKDPGQYFDPFVSVTIVDSNGNKLAPTQSTPPTKVRDEFIHFNSDVEIQLPLEQLPQGMGLFFEFKHYKPKKQKTSVKCFAFMELDEIKNGTFPLEIYLKPTDFKRKKKLVLVTERPHYLYVTVTLSEN